MESSDTLPPYSYEVLNGKDAIRILQLHVAADRKAPIKCTLKQIRIYDGGYEALSYAWGSLEKPFRAMVCDHHGNPLGYLPLTTNLNNALLDLRDSEEIEQKVFWIDQISINQEGIEKNHQVSLMREIYTAARRVIVYMGPVVDDVEEKDGLTLLRRLDEHFSPNNDVIIKFQDTHDLLRRKAELPVSLLPVDLQSNDSEAYIRDNIDLYVKQGWRWLLTLAFGDWCQRLWMAQEQLLNDCIVMLRGPRIIPWHTVAIVGVMFAVELLPFKYWRRFWTEVLRTKVGSHYQVNKVTAFTFLLWSSRKVLEMKGDLCRRGLFLNLHFCSSLDCSDSRDRIYALLGISSDASDFEISPDYSENNNPRNFFHQVSVLALRKQDINMPLTQACCFSSSAVSSIQSSPSWSLEPLTGTHVTPDIPLFGIHTPHPFDSLSVPPRIHSGNSVLVLRGRVLDRIALALLPCFKSDSLRNSVLLLDDPTSRYFIDMSHNLCSVLLYLNITIENAATLCRVLISDMTWSPPEDSRPTTEILAYYVWCYLRVWFDVIKTNLNTLGGKTTEKMERWASVVVKLAAAFPDTSNLDRFDIDDVPDALHVSTAEQLWGRTYDNGRSFCVTEQRRTCNVMNKVMEGDLIVALQGTDRLWVLRPAGDRYRLIGDAFVDGLMMGEAYDRLDPKEVDYDIELI